MLGFLFVAIVFIAVAVLAMKLFPAYNQFFSVKTILNTMGSDSATQTMSNAEIRNSFDKRANVGYVTSVTSEDLVIDRSGGKTRLTAEYEFRTKLIGNVSLVVDFSASSDPNASAAQIE
jgi:hypothetical protein